MIKVMIVDDEAPARARLSRLVAGFPDLKVVGTGLRLKLGYRRRFYTRFGYTYLASDPDDANGGHIGLGYDIYLDDGHRWSDKSNYSRCHRYSDKHDNLSLAV